MPWRLLGTSNEAEREIPLVPPKVITIGRGAECTVNLTQRTVSRLHAEIRWAPESTAQGGHWRVRDCGSTAGTYLNGVRLAPHREVRIHHADLLEIKPWRFQVEGPSADRTIAEGSATIVHESESAEEFVALDAVQSSADFARGLLVQLLAAHEEIARATDDVSVGQAAVESLALATGFSNVAFLRQATDSDKTELLASTGAILGARGELQLSRSVLKRARHQIFVHLSGASPAATLAASLDSLSIRQAICAPVEKEAMFYGWLYLDSRAGGLDEARVYEAAGYAKAIARATGDRLSAIASSKVHQRFALEKEELFGGVLRTLIYAIDGKDPYTRGHSDRVSAYAALLARAAGLSVGEIDDARMCGLVHDIGKIAVPEEILRKPTHLEPHEYALIREHPARGHFILEPTTQAHALLPGVLDHHERWDGEGYPNKLKGGAISLLGRLLSLADCFDAMTTARSYRPARTIADACSEINRCLGSHFDPDLGKIFLSIPESELRLHVKPVIALPNS